MRRALTYAGHVRHAGVMPSPCRDPNLIGEGVMNEGEFATRLGLPGIPHAAETIMLERDMRSGSTDGRALSRRLGDLP